MIVEYLCGEILPVIPSECENTNSCPVVTSAVDRKLYSEFFSDGEGIKDLELNYEQFNELLLIFKQNRITRDFFKFIFRADIIQTLSHLKEGISNFRLFAMLCYGNFRFAYKKLSRMKEKNIKKAIGKYLIEPKELEKELAKRKAPFLNIKEIEEENTVFTGYLSQTSFRLEYEYLMSCLEMKDDPKEYKELIEFYEQLSEKISTVLETATRNAEIYLTWDYLDVYIATSMRGEGEFRETYRTIKNIFQSEFRTSSSSTTLKTLNLRHFDPTQSYCDVRTDKGLLEALMLKRASLCIYMAQETDTMGKDSELATTLAQLKPVIAFVPAIEVNKYKERIISFPLSFFYKRLRSLQSEQFFRKTTVREKLEERGYIDHRTARFEGEKEEKLKATKDYPRLIESFLRKLEEHDLKNPFTLFKKSENRFKEENKELFDDIHEILAVTQKVYFDRRAELFKKKHPLSIQVDLKTGVANGVLVVRNEGKCAELVYRIFTNQLEFMIRHDKQKDRCTILDERTTGSVYRVVTDNERLSNSFWNFYLTNQSEKSNNN